MGYPLENRSYSDGSFIEKYQFTGKERNKESGPGDNDGYDYFGARYYNSRIANWTSIDPLFEKHKDFTPYNYVLGNPIKLIDPDGKQEAARKLSYPQEAVKETISEINGKIKDVFVQTKNWLGENNTIITVAKRVPYVGPAISIIEIIVSLPTPEIPVSQKATEIIEEVTPITTLNSEDSSPTLNEIQNMIQKGQSPNSIKRLDKGNPDKKEKPHLHFKNGKGKNHALNKDGTWKHGGRDLTNKEKKFLEKIGWEIPK